VSPRAWLDRLKDILVCARNIQTFISGMNFDTFLDDPKTIRAVAYELMTIGEAVRAIPPELLERHSDVPWGKMKGIRNVLVHEYYRLDEEILWETARNDIPPLIVTLEQITNSLANDSL
jgi:uncharacterized protein with HEPN domain